MEVVRVIIISWHSISKATSKLGYVEFNILIDVKFMVTLVISLFILYTYYNVFRYKTGVKITRQREYSTLSYKYYLITTITITILAFGVLYFMWKGTIFS